MKEATRQVAPRLIPLSSVVERLFKVDHQTDRPIENGRPSFAGDVFDKPKEPFVDGLVLPSYKTVEKRIRHAVFEESVEHTQLRERKDDTRERSIPLDERCCCEEVN